MPEVGRDDVDQEYEGDAVRLCDGKLCNSSVEIKRSVAVKVCHHEVCQANNNGLPLALCLKCDEAHHLGINANHARFELTKPRMKLTRSPSSHSNASDHDSGAEDISGNVKVEKKTRGYSTGKRIFKLTANSKRKPRRHNTDDPGRDYFTVMFHGENKDDIQREVVPALKGKCLKDSLEPLFSSRDLSFLTHSVFLDSSNTPLPLAFDTFPMGGNVLHVRANGVVKVDQRVIDIVQKIEDCKAPDYEQRPRSKSFMENGSLSKAKGNIKKLEQEEREKEAKEQLKTSQRGKKNIMYFFGDESANCSQALSNPALQSAVNQSMQGTLHRPKSTGKLTGLFNQPKQNKQQDTPMRAATLKDILDFYNVYGLESINDSSVKDVHDDLVLEESWTAVVDPKWIENMTKKDKDQQEATWELLSTEVTYIHKISIIKKLFILCLRNLQNEGFLKDIEIPKLFSNIETIYELNLSFWLDCLSDVVKESRKTGKPLNPLDMSESFPMFEKRFEPYITYCKEEAHCSRYFKKKMLENEDFRTYITWCEEHRLCTNRLKLSDYLVKPMQRLTKYPLLLKAIHKKTKDEEMKKDIMSMIATVETLLAKVNTAMREMYEKNKLLAISKRIKNNYNVVEAINDEMEKILTGYSSFNLMDLMPGLDQLRCVITEGPLRLVEKQGKMDVHVFLFTDLLLITKPKKGDKYRVLKPPMMVDKLIAYPSKDPGMFLLVYINEYNTVVQAFALQGSNIDQVSWVESIKKAQKLFMIARLEHGPSHMSPPTDAGELISPSAFVNMPEPLQRRRPSAISFESLDSDDEMGLNEAFRANILTRYPSDATINTVIIPENEEVEKKDEKFSKRKESVQKKREVTSKKTSSLTDLTNVNPEIVVHKGADELIQKISPINPDISRLRSEGVTKVSRSSSAPQKERRKGDSFVSLSRSCSEPKESKKFLRKTSKGEIITEGLPLDTSRTSISSSSLSADEAPKSESESSSLQTSLDLTSSFTLDNQQEDSKEDSSPNVFESPGQCESSSACAVRDDNEPCSPASDVSLTFETKPSEDDSGHSGRPVVRSASAPMPLGPRETRPHSESGDQGATRETRDEEAKSATFPRRNGNRKKSSPGLKALQSLSESLEFHLKESPSKQPPHIKSPLIAQQKLQSAISGPISNEQPLKNTSLPRRSSPLVSRRPETLMRSQSYTTLDSFSTSPGRVKDFLTLSSDSCDHPGNESNDFDDPKDVIHSSSLKRTESEGSRLPVKADRLHYSGLDLGSPDSIEQTSPIPQINAAPETRQTRKKSMSLTDLLSIGRDLTSGRDKNNDKNNSHASKRREERLSSDTTDDRCDKTTKKHQRFRLGRSKSKSGERELKDGIASGPDIDKRKATKLFLRDSLMLESSEYV